MVNLLSSDNYELVRIGMSMPQEEHMRGLTKVALREYDVKEPGNMISWMSDELDIKLTIAEERLT